MRQLCFGSEAGRICSSLFKLYNAFIRIGKDSWGIILSYMERVGESYIPSTVEDGMFVDLVQPHSPHQSRVSFCFAGRAYANVICKLQKDGARRRGSRDRKAWWRANL